MAEPDALTVDQDLRRAQAMLDEVADRITADDTILNFDTILGMTIARRLAERKRPGCSKA